MKVKGRRTFAVLAALGLAVLAGAGCAGRKGVKASADNSPATGLANAPSKIRFRSFGAVELKAVELTPELQVRRDADELARHTDRLLKHDLERLLRNVAVVPRGVALGHTSTATLQILPQVERATLVSPMKRSWLTWGAGEVEFVVRVIYRDGKTGEVLADPVFRRVSPAFRGSWSNGQSDREVEELVVADILRYTGDNL